MIIFSLITKLLVFGNKFKINTVYLYLYLTKNITLHNSLNQFICDNNYKFISSPLHFAQQKKKYYGLTYINMS